MNTDKQTQTVYIKIDYSNKIYGNNIPEYILSKYYSDKIVNLHHLQELSNVYIFTPEELETLKLGWQRELREKIEQRIAELNAVDIEFCKDRWHRTDIHPLQKQIAREESNKVTFARQELQSILQSLPQPPKQ